MHYDLKAGLLAAIVGISAPLAAQDSTRAADTTRRATPDRPVVVLDITIDPNVHEPYRVFLERGALYKAHFSQDGAVLQLRSYRGLQLPFVVNVTSGGFSSGETEYELYPQADGEIEFRPVFNAANVPIRFVLTLVRRSADGPGRLSATGTDEWMVGMEVLGGYHTALADDFSGALYEGCITARRGPLRRSIISGCVFGVGSIDAAGENGITVLFLEPRVRLWASGGKMAPPATELGVSYRIGFASLQGPGATNGGGSIFGPGVYFSQSYGWKGGKPGWILRLSGSLESVPVDDATATPLAVKVGVGRIF